VTSLTTQLGGGRSGFILQINFLGLHIVVATS
jgi:hypothetical protein